MRAKNNWKCALLRGDKNGYADIAEIRYEDKSNSLCVPIWSGLKSVSNLVFMIIFLISQNLEEVILARVLDHKSAPVYAKKEENQDSPPLSSVLLQHQSVIGSATLIRC